MVVVRLTGEMPPVVCPTLVPASDLSVERTWRAAGLAGTSSHTLVAEDVVVPDSLLAYPGVSGPLPPPEAAWAAWRRSHR